MHENTLHCVIPVPAETIPAEGTFSLLNVGTISGPAAAKTAIEKIRKAFAFLNTDLQLVSSDISAEIVLKKLPSMKDDSFRLDITKRNVILSAAGENGFLYGASALIQMVMVALREGPARAFLDCGTVKDSPRFAWRGFMLDPARHFQSADTVKRVLRLVSEFRINTFHWHLTDNQAWRIETDSAPGLAGHGTLSDGAYTRKEVKEITELAEELGITVVPEIDVPGHSTAMLKAHPELACDRRNPGREFCLGNPESLSFLKNLFDELMKLLPRSKIIHLGGDEADTSAWEKCSLCRKALKKKGLSTFRELENCFMKELAEYILSRRRTPMLWGTCSGQVYPKDAVMQAWLDIREPIRLAENGNKVVYSVHNSLYFDYPVSPAEPQEPWMFELSERGVYMTDPYIIWPDKVKDSILGAEACLWTETVPEWRVMQKILPRLPAYSECAWSRPEKKDCHDFARRKEHLEAAGYFELLREMIR